MCVYIYICILKYFLKDVYMQYMHMYVYVCMCSTHTEAFVFVLSFNFKTFADAAVPLGAVLCSIAHMHP